MRALLSLAIAAAAEASAAVMEVYDCAFDVQSKSDGSPLTLADMRSHEIIQRRLSSAAPVLSEEGKDMPFRERMGWQCLWLVDPLDGTKEFVSRNGEFTVNIAYVSEGSPVVGVVSVPARKALYFSCRGIGAFRLDAPSFYEKLPALPEEALDEILRSSTRLPEPLPGRRSFAVVASRSHMSQQTRAYIDGLALDRDVDTLSAGSSLKFCLVAEGRADVYPRLAPTMEWDTAAGQAIVEGAGGRVIEWRTGEPLKYNKEILSNPWFIAAR